MRALAAVYALIGTALGAFVSALLSTGCENLAPGTGHYWVCEILNDYGGIALLVAAVAIWPS